MIKKGGRVEEPNGQRKTGGTPTRITSEERSGARDKIEGQDREKKAENHRTGRVGETRQEQAKHRRERRNRMGKKESVGGAE